MAEFPELTHNDIVGWELSAARREAFATAYRQLARRIGAFVALPLETLSAQEIAAAARRIHEEGEA